jgi:hypothetical protein
MIGIATVARPDDDGIRNDSGRNRPYMMLMKATPEPGERAARRRSGRCP